MAADGYGSVVKDRGEWWWTGGDIVHNDHSEGHSASYYSKRGGGRWGAGAARPEDVEEDPQGHRRASYYGGRASQAADGGSAGSTSGARGAAPGDPKGSRGERYYPDARQGGPAEPRGAPVGRQRSAAQELKARREAAADASPRPLTRAPDGYYHFISRVRIDRALDGPDLPAMSRDGGSEEEFQEYWARNAGLRRLAGGWVERLSHPQVNIEPYWYNETTGQTVWEEPDEPEVPSARDQADVMSGTGPVWELSIKELKAILRSGQAQDRGLGTEELARRALAEYERFSPRVLSWHDYQHITFWFFGGMEKGQQGGAAPGAKSFFGANTGAGRELFADDAFFRATARLLMKRLRRMHPINLTYMVWTFTRAGVVVPEFMAAIGDHFCQGLIPTFDRCSLGTMVWNFSKQEVRHDRFFEDCAAELSRPNRLRSLAPRNFQNVMIAYSRRKHWNERVADALARGIPRLLGDHDPRFPKCDRKLLFAYTCRDGSEVPADAFRIGGLTVIAKAFQELRGSGLNVELCLVAMLDFVVRSVERSPPMMREQGDACSFVRQLGFLGEAGLVDAAALLEAVDLRQMVAGAPERSVLQMKHALRRCGVQADV